MHSKPIFYLAILILILLGTFGVQRISLQVIESDNKSPTKKGLSSVASKTKPDILASGLAEKNLSSDQENNAQRITKTAFESILGLIKNGSVIAAANTINQQHSNLSSSELDSLKSVFLTRACCSGVKFSDTKSILLATSKAFDHLDVWKPLAAIAVRDNDWNTAFNAYLRASELENNPSDLSQLLKSLFIASGHLRATYESNGDLISIRDLYQVLSDRHPSFQRFQYELAISKLTLGEMNGAARLLKPLTYDPELGQISKQALAKIERFKESKSGAGVAQGRTVESVTNNRLGDIVVPLISAGSSFLVDSVIERQSTRLLLDTGASITALSSQLVERLKLEPSSRSIRLNTANGITNARVYKVKQLRLNNLILRDIFIAEIDLDNNQAFQGLLGTDVLNQFKSEYSYIIDDQKKALIFRAR